MASGKSTKSDYPHQENRAWRWLWIGLVVLAALLGLAVRLYDLTDIPLDFHPTRQLHSALIARGMFYQNFEEAPAWQRERAVAQWKAEGLIEPQIMQRLTAFTYSLIGSDQLWAARLWSIFFWTLGGVFLFLLARDIAGLPGAALGVAFYALWPYAAVASRAFQPESLMVAFLILGLWLAWRWARTPKISSALLAGLACGLAIYIKSTSAFLIGPALAGLVLSAYPIKQAIKNIQVWIVGVLSLLPYALYHLFGVYVIGLLGEQYSLRFFPNLWVDPAFYLRWIGELNHVVGLEVFLAAAACALALSKKPASGMLVGFLAGYGLYGFAFSYHVSTHDYYHLPLMVFAALGLSLGFGMIVSAIQTKRKGFTLAALALLLVGFMALKAWDVRVTLKRADYRAEPAFWRGLGEELGRDSRVTGLMTDYGYRLAYWGWVNVSPWLQTADINVRELAGAQMDLQSELQQRLEENDFFVITLMAEYESQPALKEALESVYPKFIDREEVIVFDLRKGED